MKKIADYRFELIIFLSLIATMGSLYYSEVMDLTPCLLCWYQRIFMYPIPLVTIAGRLAGVKNLGKFIAALVIPGLAIAAYHVYLQAFQIENVIFGSCAVATPCQEVQYALGGVFTIAVQSLIAFTLIGTSLLLGKLKK